MYKKSYLFKSIIEICLYRFYQLVQVAPVISEGEKGFLSQNKENCLDSSK